jgi:hypothetical protein
MANPGGTMTKDEGIEYLMKDGNLKVPCSRYGTDTKTCAEVAWAAEVVYCGVAPSTMTFETLDEMMAMVVNNSDDVLYLLREYGRQYGFNWRDYVS